MKRLASAILLFCMLFLCACHGAPTQLEDETQKGAAYPSVDGAETIDGSYVFHDLLHDSTDGVLEGVRRSMTSLVYDHEYYTYDGKGIFKYDLLSGELLAACTDPGCLHRVEGCISYALPPADNSFGTVILQGIDGGVLYFSVGGKLYAYDLDKADLSLFLDLSLNEQSINAYPFGDYIYLTRRIKSEDYENSKEFVNSIARANKKNKKIETLAEMENNQTLLAFIYGDRMYFRENDYTVYSTDMDFGDRKEVLYAEWLWQFCLSGDSLIYSAITEFTPAHYMHHITIYALDLITGEQKTICDDPVIKYCVTDKYIYYIPRLGESGRYELWRIDHDGNGKTKMISFQQPEAAQMGFMALYVDGDYLLAYNAFDGVDYCYDLTNSSFTMIGSKKWYKQEMIDNSASPLI